MKQTILLGIIAIATLAFLLGWAQEHPRPNGVFAGLRVCSNVMTRREIIDYGIWLGSLNPPVTGLRLQDVATSAGNLRPVRISPSAILDHKIGINWTAGCNSRTAWQRKFSEGRAQRRYVDFVIPTAVKATPPTSTKPAKNGASARAFIASTPA